MSLNPIDYKIVRDNLRAMMARGIVSKADYEDIMRGWQTVDDWIDLSTASYEYDRAKSSLLGRVERFDPRIPFLRSVKSTWLYVPGLRIALKKDN